MLPLGSLQFQSNTIPGMLRQRARDFPDATCYRFPEREQTCTWHALWEEVQAVAAGLRRLGLQKHDRVAILLEGRAELLVSIFAAITAGGVAVPLSTYLKKEELKVCLREARPAVFIMGSADHHLSYLQLQAEVAAQPGPDALTDARWIPHHAFVQGPAVAVGSGFRSYEELTSRTYPEGPAAEDRITLTAQDPAFLLFTSGSTGTPKGIVRSAASFMARNPMSAGSPPNAFKRLLARKGNRYVNRFGFMSLLPLHHLAGIGMMLMPLQVCNVPLTLLARFNPIRGLAAIAQTKARFLIGTPHMMQAMLAQKSAAPASLDSVLGVFFASAALRPHVLERALQGFQNLCFFAVSYGSTETGAVANGTCFVPNRRHPAVSLLLRLMRRLNYLDGEIPLAAFSRTTASIGGKIARQVEVGIRSPQSGAWLPPGEEGEILVRSHRLMPYQDASSNQVHRVEGGWFKTGDLGYVDAQNCLMITDRLKQLISRGGEKIAPAEIEHLIKQQPGIDDVLVLGIPDALYGEVVGAAFTETNGGAVSVAALREALHASLSSFKVPQHFLSLPTLPLNAAGKIDVAEVRLELEQMIQREYA
ncbi:acyl-CoA synthetase [Hymenobacter seoulensis]